MRRSVSRFAPYAALLVLFVVCGCQQQTEQSATEEAARSDLNLEGIPRVVMDGLMARFPGAEIRKWTKEEEDGVVIYDFEFTQEGLSLEADVREDGSIHNWERAIEMADLPDAVRMSAQARYPGATVGDIMEITAVVDGQDALEGYEIVLETTDTRVVEIAVTPDGEIFEDSGQASAGEAVEEE